MATFRGPSILVFLGLLIVSTSYGQTGWVKQIWSNPDLVFYDVTFVFPSRGYIVGDAGTILQSIDGGATWTAQNSGTTEILHGIRFLDATFGVAVGAKGTMLFTTDLGASWTNHSLNTNESLFDVLFLTRDTGFVVGSSNTVLRTTDGGLTWADCKAGFGANSARAISFPSRNLGFIVGHSGKIARTRNGGKDWTQLSSHVDQNFFAVSFADTLVGTAVGRNGAFSHTWDGGKTWYPDSILSLSSYQLTDIQYVTPTRGYFVTWGGVIYRTDDAGRTWGVQESNSFDNLEAVFFTSPWHGVAVGWYGTILRTQDGGPTDLPSLSSIPRTLDLGVPYPHPVEPGRHQILLLPIDLTTPGELDVTLLSSLGVEILHTRIPVSESGRIVLPISVGSWGPGVHALQVRQNGELRATRSLLVR